MLIQRECAHKECGIMFEPKRSDQIYHDPKCKIAAFKSKKVSNLGSTHTSVSLAKTNSLTPPEPLPVGAKFVLDELTRQRDKLENELETAEQELKTATQRIIDLEKERDSAKGELEKKPGALAGFFSDPVNIKDLMKELPEMIGGIASHFRKQEGAAPAQIGAAPTQQQEPLIKWLVAQTPEFRQHFMDVVNALAQNPERAFEILASFKRNLMSAGIKTGT